MEGCTFLIEHLLLPQLFYLTFTLQYNRQTFIISPYNLHRKVCLLRLHSDHETRTGKDNCIRFTAFIFRNLSLETMLFNKLQQGCHFTDKPPLLQFKSRSPLISQRIKNAISRKLTPAEDKCPFMYHLSGTYLQHRQALVHKKQNWIFKAWKKHFQSYV